MISAADSPAQDLLELGRPALHQDADPEDPAPQPDREDREEDDPRQPYLDAARILTEASRPEKALECYNMTLMLDPANLEALVYKGTTLTELQHYDEALEIFNRILKTIPDLEEAMLGKGFALLGLGKTEEALQLPGFAIRLKELV